MFKHIIVLNGKWLAINKLNETISLCPTFQLESNTKRRQPWTTSYIVEKWERESYCKDCASDHEWRMWSYILFKKKRYLNGIKWWILKCTEIFNTFL